MKKADCLFCKIVASEIPSHKIFEDEKLFSFLDIVPVGPGHVLVIPKVHSDDFNSTSDELICETMILAKKIGAAIIRSEIAGAINYQINNGKIAGQSIGHFHLHIIPRNFGDGLELWTGKPYSSGEAEKVAKRLTDTLILGKM